MREKLEASLRYIAIAGSILLLLICYLLAFSKTIGAFQTNAALKNRLPSAATLSFQPAYLLRKNHNLDTVLAYYQLDSLTLRGAALARISLDAGKENVVLSNVPVENASLHTTQFILENISFEGDYTSLLKTLTHLETSRQSGVVRSLTIHAKGSRDKTIKQNTVMDVLIEVSK